MCVMSDEMRSDVDVRGAAAAALERQLDGTTRRAICDSSRCTSKGHKNLRRRAMSPSLRAV
jgi:hypothetical protein